MEYAILNMGCILGSSLIIGRSIMNSNAKALQKGVIIGTVIGAIVAIGKGLFFGSDIRVVGVLLVCAAILFVISRR